MLRVRLKANVILIGDAHFLNFHGWLHQNNPSKFALSHLRKSCRIIEKLVSHLIEGDIKNGDNIQYYKVHEADFT